MPTQRGLGLDLKIDYNIRVSDYREFLSATLPNSVALLLTDPPYAISRKTGFHRGGIEQFRISMDFGKWDHQEIDLSALAHGAYRTLRKGGTAIIFYDTWKIERLRNALESVGFSMFRLVIWEKTNPIPLNAGVSYLTNSRELGVLCVKGGKPTFNTEYHKGIFYSSRPSVNRIHPTQKPIRLFQDLIEIHSNPGDTVLDCFLGSGTTAFAALSKGRKIAGCDIDPTYIKRIIERLEM